MARPLIEPLTAQTLPEFADFLHANLNAARSPFEWLNGLSTQWDDAPPNYGFALRDAGRMVGGIGLLYATRRIHGRLERFCNMSSWCVLNAYRKESMRLAIAVLSQPGFNFTNFTPTQVVGGVLRFLKFKPIDNRQTVFLNLPAPLATGRIISAPESIAATLCGEALQAYRDSVGFPWLHHVLIGSEPDWCHVIYKREHFKGLPAARVIHLSDGAVFNRHLRRLTTHFLRRGLFSSHIETRRLHKTMWPSKIRSDFNARLFLGPHIEEGDIDYLYSEIIALDL